MRGLLRALFTSFSSSFRLKLSTLPLSYVMRTASFVHFQAEHAAATCHLRAPGSETQLLNASSADALREERWEARQTLQLLRSCSSTPFQCRRYAAKHYLPQPAALHSAPPSYPHPPSCCVARQPLKSTPPIQSDRPPLLSAMSPLRSSFTSRRTVFRRPRRRSLGAAARTTAPSRSAPTPEDLTIHCWTERLVFQRVIAFPSAS